MDGGGREDGVGRWYLPGIGHGGWWVGEDDSKDDWMVGWHLPGIAIVYGGR